MKRLIRPRTGKMIGGVCAALGNYFGIDATIVRIIFVVLALPGGFPGVIPYVILWVLIPQEQ